MNFNKLLGGLALTTLLGVGLSSCSNDMDQYEATNSLKTVVNKAPKIQAYSGVHFWGPNGAIGTTTRAEGISWSEIETSNIDRAFEDEYISGELPEYGDNIEGHDADFLYHATKSVEIELYPVFARTTNKDHDFGIFYFDSEGNRHEEVLWTKINPWDLSRNEYVWSEETQSTNKVEYSKGIKVQIPEGLVFGFYITECDIYPIELEGQIEKSICYSAFNLNKESYYFIEKPQEGESYGVDMSRKSQIHAVTWQANGQNYLGFEDWADFDYQDLVFTVSPGIDTVDASTFEPGTTPNPDPDDPVEDPDDPSEEPEIPSIVPGDDHTNEVEVNLAVDTKGETSNGEYNESHLSIHVRSAVDVDMFIPMPLNMICPADDMEIVQKHLAGEMEHGGDFTNAQYDEDGKVIMQGGLLSKMTYKIADRWDVSVYVEYVDNPEEGIHIWTEGLANNTELFEYLQETYGDGITFEIWNYYSDESTPNELKENLDKATIDFIGNVLPDFFINAFGEENFNEGKDCTVNLVDEQANNFEDMGEGPHLNASEHNKIYKNNTKDRPEPPVY